MRNNPPPRTVDRERRIASTRPTAGGMIAEATDHLTLFWIAVQNRSSAKTLAKLFRPTKVVDPSPSHFCVESQTRNAVGHATQAIIRTRGGNRNSHARRVP